MRTKQCRTCKKKLPESSFRVRFDSDYRNPKIVLDCRKCECNRTKAYQETKKDDEEFKKKRAENVRKWREKKKNRKKERIKDRDRKRDVSPTYWKKRCKSKKADV